MLPGKFSIMQTSKDWKIIKPSGHTVGPSLKTHKLSVNNGFNIWPTIVVFDRLREFFCLEL